MPKLWISILFLRMNGEKKVHDVKLDIEHLFLVHVNFWSCQENSVAYKSNYNVFKIDFAKPTTDVDKLDCYIEPSCHETQPEGRDWVRKGSGVEKDMAHHLDTIPHIVNAHPVDHNVHQEIGRLHLKFGSRNISILFLIWVDRHAVVHDQNRKDVLDCHYHGALFEKIG